MSASKRVVAAPEEEVDETLGREAEIASNILRRAKVAFSENRYVFYPYVILSFGVSLIEVFLISSPPVGPALATQVLLLVLGTILCVVGTLLTASHIDITHDEAQEMTWMGRMRLVFDLEVNIDFYCIIIGWMFISSKTPGVASFRGFRILRYLWYTELVGEEELEGFKPEEICKREHVYNLVDNSFFFHL